MIIDEMLRFSWCLRAIAGLLFLLRLGLCATASADTGGSASDETLAIPFPFYNESFGFGVGYVYGRSSWPEPQSRLLGTVMGGTAGSAMPLIAGQDLRTPWLERLFIDPFASVGYFGDTESYIDGNPDFPNEDAGTNGSSKKNFVSGEGFDNFLRIRLHYLLPLGHGRDQIVPRYELVDGLPVGGFTGARSLTPFKSGRAFVDFRPFSRAQQIDGDGQHQRGRPRPDVGQPGLPDQPGAGAERESRVVPGLWRPH